ncbi:MAG: hypothetical protein MJZ92_01940 [Paludibacteraceae bacterium]|nr:hypothetical protein [Paludibacteraceae bacterium]
MNKYFACLFFAFSFVLSISAQTFYEDGYNYLYDYDHRIVVRACVEVTEDYQDLWNGDYARISGGYVNIYRNGSKITYGNHVWLEHTGYYTVLRGSYYYLVDPDGYNTGVSGDNIYVLWNGVYVVLKGSYWQLYTEDGHRLGNAYSTENITIYWNGYYCVYNGSYYYVYGPDGYRVGSLYSDDEPTLTNAGYFRCRHGNYCYLYDTNGNRAD